MGSYHFGAGWQWRKKDPTVSNCAVINCYSDYKAESIFIIISFPRAITQHIQYFYAGKDIPPAQLYTVSAGSISNYNYTVSLVVEYNAQMLQAFQDDC